MLCDLNHWHEEVHQKHEKVARPCRSYNTLTAATTPCLEFAKDTLFYIDAACDWTARMECELVKGRQIYFQPEQAATTACASSRICVAGSRFGGRASGRTA